MTVPPPTQGHRHLGRDGAQAAQGNIQITEQYRGTYNLEAQAVKKQKWHMQYRKR